MFATGCPRADELEALAKGRDVSKRIAQHIGNCETCSQMVETLRRDAGLIAELREARRDALDEVTHEQVLDLCRAASLEAKE